ncbi:MAG TPA: oligopeptide/dipeptide ABC transporter ATP-binding protein [Candidatus Dormibacteraeota bacterium]|nr:oligopeptide/dipeptide ABC transporter ATP-binding protein [Candidatus Dormibacteraeota bacterium]
MVAGQPAANLAAVDREIVKVEDVYKYYPAGGGQVVQAVAGVDLQIRRGETLGLVGESGCGKSTLARLITALQPVTKGRILFNGQDLNKLHGGRLRQVRREMQIIFQDPFASLDPRMTIGDIIAEPIDNFRLAKGKERRTRVQELLRLVGLNPNFTNRYPHEFSGGQRQRIGIARALSVSPSFIVCDEPVSALDVSIQAQIINLLQDLQREFKLTYLFIAHDLAVVRHLSDRIAVMYLGKVVEVADRVDIYEHSQHPYTKALLTSIPVPDPSVERDREPILLKGEIPSPVNPPSGCRFHTRCSIARAPGICSEQEPPLEPHGHRDQVAACHFAGEA